MLQKLKNSQPLSFRRRRESRESSVSSRVDSRLHGSDEPFFGDVREAEEELPMNTQRRLLSLALSMLVAGWAFGASEEGRLAPGMVNPGYQDTPRWFKASFLDIREDAAEAAQAGKRVLLYFYQDGCPYCKKLMEDNFGQREISDKAREYFDVIAINMWGDREVTDFNGESTTEKQFARDLKVMFTPTLLLLNERSEVVLRVNGYFPPHRFLRALDYVGQRLENRSSFRDYAARQAPEPASGKLHVQPSYLQPPYRLGEVVKRNGKPLIVMFEQQQCARCDELHLDILERERSKALLDEFDIVLLDKWSNDGVQTPDGRTLSIVQWAKALDVNYAPSMVFFDRRGEEVFRTEAYLKAFHIQCAMDYVASGAYLEEPEFQRYISRRADALRAQGIEVNLMQ